MTTPKENTKAPNFSGKDQYGNLVTLDQFIGNVVILFFYPQNCLSTCLGGCALRDNFSEWADKGYKIIGVCNKNFEAHKNFIKQHDFPCILIADTNKRIAHKYGVWRIDEESESLMHATFVISPGGFIKRIITDATKDEHSQQIDLLKKINFEYLS
jgi:thioredoxin-dependent peroxiredoxin